MFKSGNSTRPSVEAAKESLLVSSALRNLSWSFIGTTQGYKERGYALGVFSTWPPYLHQHGLDAVTMHSVYKRSKYVVVGRGQSNLDCYRIYEAIIAGAIPIVVGSKGERERTFEFEGDQPPLLFADSYEKALEMCKNMTDAEIDTMRTENVNWYVSRINLIRRRIDLFLTVFG